MKRNNLAKAKRTIEKIDALEAKINLLTAMGSDEPHPELKLTLSRDKISETIVIDSRTVLITLVTDRLVEIRAELARLETILEGL